MAIKTGSLKKEEGYVADSILIAELIDYAVEEGPFSYFELIEKLSSKIMGYEENEDEDALIHGRTPDKYLDVIVRHSKFFKDYFESVENDEYHSVEVSIPLGKLDSDDDDEDYESDWGDDDDDDFWQQDMKNKLEKEKIKKEKEELRAQKGAEKEAYCHCPSDGVCYCEFPEDEEPQPKKELKDFVWLPNNADQVYREAKAPSQLSQSCQKEAMLVDYVKKLQHEAENLFNELEELISRHSTYIPQEVYELRNKSGLSTRDFVNLLTKETASKLVSGYLSDQRAMASKKAVELLNKIKDDENGINGERIQIKTNLDSLINEIINKGNLEGKE